MRLAITLGILGGCLLGVSPCTSHAQAPQRLPDVEGSITTITAATEAEKQAGQLATIKVKGSAIPVQITTGTFLQIARGKLVEEGSAGAFRVGDRVSVWLEQLPTEANPPPTRAKAVILFRPGKPDLPPAPPADLSAPAPGEDRFHTG